MPKENFRMGKGWRGEGPLAVAEADQALVERKGPTLLLGLACLRALPETPRAATIAEIYFCICSNPSPTVPKLR
jgi:hypothetical protein